MSDVLTLGGISFDDFSTPDLLGAGGRQQMVVRKLPGGSRVIDCLGPDEKDISWFGTFFGDYAYENVLALDAMRASGQIVELVFGGQFRTVLVEYFEYKIRRLPVWVEYQINCVVYNNPSLGTAGGVLGSIDTMILSDLATALSL